MIANAKTPEDRQKLATYYRQEAEWLGQRSREYEELAAVYKKRPQMGAGKNLWVGQGVVQCQRFAKLYAEEAKEAKALAKMHELVLDPN